MVNLPLFFLYFAEVPHTKNFSMKTRNMYKPQPRGWKGSLFHQSHRHSVCGWPFPARSLLNKLAFTLNSILVHIWILSYVKPKSLLGPESPFQGLCSVGINLIDRILWWDFKRIKFYFSKSKKPETFLNTSPFIQCISYYMILNESI